ncbi:TetR family transcriptional regulator [Mycobacterium antarcticum]|nr:TetR family transcriptional regulator [Mycolicibacterium sp. TUM20985]GLP77428.1 TetR family transcriptional regulator [Mycolicibacterium sp. TUM20983]GLP82168.1 TetR family transcriptional regulator [Mycolicibacterium sp. TUM20984]
MPLTDRRTERRGLLIAAAFTLFGEGGEAAVSVRSVCRECELNTRYFYESFDTVDHLLGALYDDVNLHLAAAVQAAIEEADEASPNRTRAGMVAVLRFSSEDPRRGRILFTDARTNPVLAERRLATQNLLFEMVVAEGGRQIPDPVAARVGAAMYTGAMVELAQQWLAGNLGTDVDAVVDHALTLVVRE